MIASLDTPDLELLILQSLATTLSADVSTKSDDGIEYLISGLPGNFSNDLSNEEVWVGTSQCTLARLDVYGVCHRARRTYTLLYPTAIMLKLYQ
jgi:hypothetical protein